MEFIGTISESPGLNNDANFNIARFVKDQINTDNDLSDTDLPNYIDNWTSFYIKYYESYDLADGNNVVTFNSTAEFDEISGCSVTEMVTNGDFATDLTGWTNLSSYTWDGQAKTPDAGSWLWVAGEAKSLAGTKKLTPILYQGIPLRAGTKYNFSIDFTASTT